MKKLTYIFLFLVGFLKAQTPTISNFNPASGPMGTSVIITGTNFSSTLTNNIVYFGATRATVTAATANQLTVTVPTGATYQPISVLVNGLTAYSVKPFVVTFPGGGTIDACSFAPKVDFATGNTPGGIVIIDVDGDGKSDMAIVNQNNNTLSVYRNTTTAGDITPSSFAAKVDFATTTSPTDLAAGDMDGDGKLDLVAVNTASTVSVFLNTSTPGTISFATKVDYTIISAGGGAARRVAVGDLDGDGKPEIAEPTGLKFVSVLQNQCTPGNISFSTNVDFNISTLNSNPLSIAIGDVDGDAKPEMAVMQSNTISVLRNTSTVGTIDASSFASYVGFLAGTGAQDLAIGDLDGDSKPDFVTANHALGTSISVLRNTSSPGVIDATSFAAKVDFVLSSTATALPHGVAINDIDGDGKPDIALAQSFSTSSSVFKNKTITGTIDASSFTPEGFYSTGTAQLSTHRIATGDLDGDGKPEMVIVNNKISVFRNTTINLPPTISTFSPTSGPIGTAVTITGTNFSSNPSNNVVYFNGVYSPVTSSTDTQIIVNVPFDATPGPITVSVVCKNISSITSTGNFVVNGLCVTSKQRNALLNLYNDTDGSNWNINTNWFTPDISTWFGVTVTGCFVTGIDLAENNLTGELPSQLKDLTALTNLYLKENELTGDVPAEIGMLSNLQTLDLSVNHFSGLPDFSSSSLDQANLSFQVYGNDLDFADLEPNIVFSQFNYTPQNDIPPGDIISFVPGQSLDIPFTTPGTANSYQWFYNSVAVGSPSAGGDYSKPNAVAGDVGQYIVEITNSIVPGLTLKSVPYTVVTDPCISATRTAGYLDLAFDPLIDNQTAVTAVALQSTGQIIVSTGPISIDGASFDGIVRYNADGSLDDTFVANSTYSNERQLAVQSNDKIISTFSPYSSYSDLIRLNADGSTDASFTGTSSDFINGFALQPDDYIIVSFSNFIYTLESYLVRLDPDGNTDNSFTTVNLAAKVIKVQSDGFILAGGYFPGGITRFTPTGAVDSGFTGYLDGEVTDIAIQSDGKIIVVGTFNDTSMRGIVRLNMDGSVDPTFTALGISSIPSGTYPTKVLIQSDGQIIIGGFFDVVNGTNHPNLVRLNIDGTPDCSFDPGLSSDDAIVDMAFDATENIFMVGGFTSYDGTIRNGLARIKTSTSTSCVPVVQKAALVALYNATNGANWTVKTNWLTGDASNWFGVTVVGCNVTKVELPNNNLTGSLPNEIGDLTGLIELKLSYNHLTGNLPSSITNLSNLERLILDNNQTLSGPLPASIGSMTALREINTQANVFTGPIPATMANCLALEYIQLEGNKHTGSIPTFFGSLTNLISINIGFNLLTGTIPSELGLLSNLTFLSFADNDLTGTIPIELGSLSVLGLLDLSRNQLTSSIPSELGNLSSLVSLQLWDNKLTGSIPTQLGNLSVLQDMNLSVNQLSGSIPIEFGDLSAITFLQVYTNQLTGTIPAELGNATTMKFMRLSDNLLTGSIPTSFENMSSLYLLDLDRNQLTGSIPSEFGNITSLKYLNLNINQLSGSIPPELGNLLLLEDLNIYANQLTGSLPIELGQCVNLKRFGAGDNQLSGTLPKEYGSWTNLTDFGIYNNNITGAIPSEYLAWTNPVFLYFSGNKLDAIPTFTATTITEFNVFDNLFEFGDLESNIGIPGYNYSPQADLPGGNFTLDVGNPLTIPFATSGSANHYQWLKNGESIPGATTATFSIASTAVSDAGVYTVQITSTLVTGLTLKSLPFVVSIMAPPVINITSITVPLQGSKTIDLLTQLSDPNGDLDLSSLTIAVQPASGAVASLNGTMLTLDYTEVNFSGTDFFTLSICDLADNCAQQQISVEVVGNLVVYNALSPGDDGKNDIFYLEYVDILESTKNNKVIIFNRWGDVVFEIDNYNNTTRVFRGQNKNGNELPTGTYFYKITFQGGAKPVEGFISLKR